MEAHGDKEILKMISLAYRKMQIYLTMQTEPLGLSSGLAPFVMITCENGEMPQNRFCELLDISKSTAAKTLARLEEMGYVRREENQQDGRSVIVYPTEKARAVYPYLREIGTAWVRKMTEGLTEQEQAVFFRTMSKISRNISDYF